jgi:hypothetical protein
MRPSEALKLHRDRIREIALSHRVTNVRVFGSAVTLEDTEQSDLDLLVQQTSETTYFDLGAIQYELSDLLGFNVDVLTPDSLPARFHDQVLHEAQPL